MSKAAEFGVSASQYVFSLGGKLVQRANRTTLVAFLECHLTGLHRVKVM
jgi:hypothetical protein